MSYSVYLWTNTQNGKKYVGVTNNTYRRWNKHLHDALHGSSCVFHKAIRKYGPDVWIRKILIDDLDREDAIRKEIDLILEHNSQIPHGYNMTAGGQGLSGHTHSKESKQKMKWSTIKKDKYKQMYQLNGHPSTGKPSKLRGRPRPEAKLWHAIDWQVITPEGETININNLKEYCRLNKLNSGHMTSVAGGKLRSHKGYRCRKSGEN
jgi:group I intron endonuclease